MTSARGTLALQGPDERDLELLAAVEHGVPIVPRPYAEIAACLGMPEAEAIERLARLRSMGVLKRFGVVVRHHELGYRANAMVVWNVPDPDVDSLGERLAAFEFVTLCYRRARALPHWPYNLYCMVHGRDRHTVMEQVDLLARGCGLEAVEREVLFSRRRFKQRGARYRAALRRDVPVSFPGVTQ
jgi:DNA-binding Lrp family transcriptional regulator